MADLFRVSAAQVAKELGDGPHTAATLLSEYGWTFARVDASPCATYIDKSGLVQTAVAGSLRVQYQDLDGDGARETCGLLLEGTRTNVVLWNRDLTNAAWTKVNVTPVKDQVGVDGVAASASKITATAGNGTCLQAITLGSSARAQSAYVKRITGSGTINMTMDNGGTWTAITVTAAWTRVTIPTQTIANPTVGFRIVTNGDAIAVDYVQNENGVFESSAIPVTTVAVVRAGDSLTVPFNFGPMDLTVLGRVARPVHADAAGTLGVFPTIFSFSGGSVPRYVGYFDSSTRNLFALLDTTVTDVTRLAAIPAGAEIVYCSQLRAPFTGGMLKLDVGGGFGAESTAASPISAFANQSLGVGDTSGQQLFGVLIDLKGRAGLVTRAAMLQETPFAPFNPVEVTDLEVPGPLISKSQSGKVTTRGTQAIGRTWRETYLLNVQTASHKGFLASINTLWRNGTQFSKSHADYLTPKGVGGGFPLVMGASQTGSTLIVDGAPANTPGWLLAGDIFRTQGLPQVFQCAADVHTEGSGRALIPLVVPIFTGGSPADNATVTITAVPIDVVILEPPTMPETSGQGADYGTCEISFSEAL